LIPLLSRIKDKALIIGPVHFPHFVFDNDYLAGTSGINKTLKKFEFKNKKLFDAVFKMLFKKTIVRADKVIAPNQQVKKKRAGSNHNGSLEQAKKLIDVAAEAGADAVKFQIFKAEDLYSKYTPEFNYLKGQNTYELIKSIETPREWIKELAGYCKEKNIDFLASVFDFEAIGIRTNFINS